MLNLGYLGNKSSKRLTCYRIKSKSAQNIFYAAVLCLKIVKMVPIKKTEFNNHVE